MRLRHGVIAALAALLIAVPAAVAQPGSTRTDVTGAVGQPVTIDDEVVHTVLRVERWYGGGLWLPPAGKAAVAVDVRFQALQKSSYNQLYYELVGADETGYGRVVLGARDPSLVAGDLAPGATVEGWMTFLVPTGELRGGLTLSYHSHGGFGSTLTVPLGSIPDSRKAQVGRNAAIAGEQALKVTRVERPATFGMWKPQTGSVFVTPYVKLRALKATTSGRFTAFTAAGKTLGGVMTGNRTPAFPTGKALASGKTVEGWVTLMVPKAQAHGLTLVYHLPGNRDTLLIPLPG